MTVREGPVTARKIALALAGLNTVVLLAAIGFGIRLLASLSAEEFLFTHTWPLASIVYSGLAVLIIFRQPRHTVGWLFLVIGFLDALTYFGVTVGDNLELSIIEPFFRSDEAQILLNIAGELLWILALFLPITLMLQFFPDGRLPSRRWWPIPVATIIAMFTTGAGFVLEQEGYTGFPDWLEAFVTIFFSISILGSVAAVLVRFIRSQDAERMQMKWLVYTAVVGILLMFLLVLVLDDDHPVLGIYTTLLPSLLAISVGIAILRYRLYDIDVLIRRTLQYGIVTGLLALIYFGLVILFQSLFVAIGATESSIFIVISTLVVAGLFNPLRARVQKSIDRRFYRKKYQAEQVLGRFATTARDEVDLDKLARELLEVVRETMQPENASLLLLSDDRYSGSGAPLTKTSPS